MSPQGRCDIAWQQGGSKGEVGFLQLSLSFFSVAQQALVGQGLLIVEASR
jgi:hypothetical protein